MPSPRQMQAIAILAEDYTVKNDEIAWRLGNKVDTVRALLRSAVDRLGIPQGRGSRERLATWYCEWLEMQRASVREEKAA